MKTPSFTRLLPAAVFLMAATTLSAQAAATRRNRATPGARNTNATTPAAATPANAAVSATEVAQQLAKAERGKGGRPKLKFDNAPAELFLQLWSQVTGRTLLTSPDVPKVTMSLRSNGEEDWSDEEYLQAIEQQLQLNGIGLLPVGDHFALVVPFKTIGQQGIETYLEIPAAGRHPEMGQIIRQIITPKHVSAEEAQAAIESFKRPDGQIQFLERTNSLLITDTQENVNRMIEIINFIDKPMPVLEEVQVCPIKYAKAVDVKKALEEFVEASREETTTKTTKGAPQVSNSLSQGMQAGTTRRTRSLPGVTRPQDNL
ncbi:MAG: secretin N-terminal domain-containing protein, partial [bacterium]|nr:secretin N-terminal domain-containing protein [bacterium]